MMRFENTGLFRQASRFAQGSRNNGSMLTWVDVRRNMPRYSNQLTVIAGVFDVG